MRRNLNRNVFNDRENVSATPRLIMFCSVVFQVKRTFSERVLLSMWRGTYASLPICLAWTWRCASASLLSAMAPRSRASPLFPWLLWLCLQPIPPGGCMKRSSFRCIDGRAVCQEMQWHFRYCQHMSCSSRISAKTNLKPVLVYHAETNVTRYSDLLMHIYCLMTTGANTRLYCGCLGTIFPHIGSRVWYKVNN